jgi:hypothetical protein
MTEDSDARSEGVVHADVHRSETVSYDYGEVRVEEYPGGDMLVKTGTEEIYLSSGAASALRTALGRIDGSKRGDSDE